MSSKFELTYFNVRGRAEVSRLLFAQAGVEYTDTRVTGEQFAEMKKDPKQCPLGQLPTLKVDDHPVIPQSHVIERYLARKFKLMGANEQETVKIDVACETVGDLYQPLIKMHFEKDEAKKAEMAKEFLEKQSVPLLRAMEHSLKSNNEGAKYFVGNSMTLADITIFNCLDGLMKHFEPLRTKYPTLKAFVDRMNEEPKLKAWIEKRPKTDL